jgi:hypothetical protein
MGNLTIYILVMMGDFKIRDGAGVSMVFSRRAFFTHDDAEDFGDEFKLEFAKQASRLEGNLDTARVQILTLEMEDRRKNDLFSL